MDIFVYSDESGVLDYIHNDFFAFGGIIFLSKEDKDTASRKFLFAEKALRTYGKHENNEELKACRITSKEKGKLFRSLNKFIKFGVVIKQKNIHQRIFDEKKSKQRYLDYAYKIALKRAFETLIKQGKVTANDVSHLHVFVDEHTTATNGRYELRESLEQEFKNGTFNYTYSNYFPPIFSNLQGIDLHFCDSSTKTLIRAADIVANQIYYCAVKNDAKLYEREDFYLIDLP